AVRERRAVRKEHAGERVSRDEHAKRVARHNIAEHETALGACERADVREALRRERQRAQILILPPGQALAPAAAVLEKHLKEGAGVADRERPQDVGVENREDARVQAQAERDRERHRCNEGRSTAETAEREAQVMEHATPAAPLWERAWKRGAQGTMLPTRSRGRAR